MRNKRLMVTQLMKLAFQFLLYGLSFLTFFYLLSLNNPQMINLSRTAAITTVIFVVIMAIFTFVYGGYDIGEKKVRTVFSSILLTTLFADVVTYLLLQIMNVNEANNEHLMLLGRDFPYFLLAIAVQTGFSYLFVALGYWLYFRINPPERCCLITSSQELAEHVAQKIASFHQKYKLCDVVHYECPDVKDTIRKHDIVFLAGIPDTEEGRLQNFCYRRNKSIYLLAELEDVIISTAQQSILDDTPFLYIHRVVPTPMQRLVKRLIDLFISIFGLILFSPVMLIAAACIFFSDRGTVLFRQKRATIDGKVFEIIKLRTMYMNHSMESEPVSAQEDDSRVTRLGRVLRKYRIDELPQLFNVLRGDMSIVGPRPEMLRNVEKYEMEVPEFKYRQQMKAGLTGLAQIDGKYNTSPKDKAILDLLYIENFSIPMDLKLILRTLTIFFRRDSTEGFQSSKGIACPRMRTEPLIPAPGQSAAPAAKKPGAAPAAAAKPGEDTASLPGEEEIRAAL